MLDGSKELTVAALADKLSVMAVRNMMTVRGRDAMYRAPLPLRMKSSRNFRSIHKRR
jgi:hypothetical protein